MELRGIAFWSYLLGELALTSLYGLLLLDWLAVLEVTGAWRVVGYAACVVTAAGLGLAYGLGWYRASKRRQPGGATFSDERGG